MTTNAYGTPPTVEQVIEALKHMEPGAPCYVRLKYHGSANKMEDIPLHLAGISAMEPEGQPTNVTFLC